MGDSPRYWNYLEARWEASPARPAAEQPADLVAVPAQQQPTDPSDVASEASPV